MVGVIAIWLAGIALTLAPSLLLIVAGLALGAGCGLIFQAVSTGYVTVTAKTGRSSAVGLYVTSFYLGGSFGRRWARSPGRSAAGRPALRWSRRCWWFWPRSSFSAWSGTTRQEKPSPIEPPWLAARSLQPGLRIASNGP